MGYFPQVRRCKKPLSTPLDIMRGENYKSALVKQACASCKAICENPGYNFFKARQHSHIAL